MAKRLEFKDVWYDPDHVCWGRGNHIVALQVLARFQIAEPTNEEESRIKAKWEQGKAIYDEKIIKGARFKPAGKNTTNAICEITYVSAVTQYVTWTQVELSQDWIERGIKPAAGKWPIGSLVNMVQSGQIEFIN